ncbi:hypothetical protein [Rhodococcus gannanensis]|uniref:VOC family protein n=1 Tax=Rhodococcus gannanensis TaxID=1960308 RepID=A0ABW4P9E5_9NOCA
MGAPTRFGRNLASPDRVDAGFDHLALTNAGPDPDGFLDFYRDEPTPTLRTVGGPGIM